MEIANIHEAESQLSKLIEHAMNGEEVIIAEGGRPMVRLVPIPADDMAALSQEAPAHNGSGPRLPEGLEDVIREIADHLNGPDAERRRVQLLALLEPGHVIAQKPRNPGKPSDAALVRAMIRYKHAGKWLAWLPDGSNIVEIADTRQEIQEKWLASKIPGLTIECAPLKDRR